MFRYPRLLRGVALKFGNAERSGFGEELGRDLASAGEVLLESRSPRCPAAVPALAAGLVLTDHAQPREASVEANEARMDGESYHAAPIGRRLHQGHTFVLGEVRVVILSQLIAERFERVVFRVAEQRLLLHPTTALDLVILPPRRGEVQ